MASKIQFHKISSQMRNWCSFEWVLYWDMERSLMVITTDFVWVIVVVRLLSILIIWSVCEQTQNEASFPKELFIIMKFSNRFISFAAHHSWRFNQIKFQHKPLNSKWCQKCGVIEWESRTQDKTLIPENWYTLGLQHVCYCYMGPWLFCVHKHFTWSIVFCAVARKWSITIDNVVQISCVLANDKHNKLLFEEEACLCCAHCLSAFTWKEVGRTPIFVMNRTG